MCQWTTAARPKRAARGERPVAHPFLSEAWFDAVEALRDKAPPPPEEVAGLAVNMVVTGGPDGDRMLHFADSRFDRGLAPGAPTTVIVPHRVARAMLVDADPQAAIEAFMTGEIRVEGDLSRLMELQQSAGMLMPTAEQLAFFQRVRDLTT
jgi:hypothetical protein